MAATRAERYESKTDADGIQALSKKLTADLRKHIRTLGAFPVMSESWVSMANALGRIANISAMERKLPKDKDEATLWECEELALRYLLEDGKLNLCLRLLQDFRVWKASGKATDLSETQAAAMVKFEKGIGELLKNAWMHAEALQTTDLPLMIAETGGILADAAESKFESSIAELLPSTAVHFVLAIGKHLDSIDESRVMPLMMTGHVVKNLIIHVSKHHAVMTEEDLRAAAEAIALLADSEEVRTFPDRYLEDDDCRRELLKWKSAFVRELTSDRDVRRQLRPMLDLMDTAERAMLK